MNKESKKVRFPIKNEVKKVRFSDLTLLVSAKTFIELCNKEFSSKSA